MTRAEFLEKAKAAAKAAAATSGFPAGIAVAQAALESAWGGSLLAREAHNYFGIKASGTREAITLPTWEVVDGTPQRAVARFARYASMEECFADRDAIIARARCYAGARAAAAEPEGFARALAERWATDPDYAKKVLAIYRTHRLFEMDSAAEARG
jgi:flagellum-specific peptidoglycan hydrolase FlgJ